MKFWTGIVVVLLLAGIFTIPGVNAENQTMDTAYYLTHAETLAGQKDMSMYNKPRPVEPPQMMNETTAQLYPNVTWCGKDCMVPRSCSFPFTRCESPLTVMVVYNVNATNPGQPGPVIGYGVTGWPLRNPVFQYESGISDINPLSGTLAGMFHPMGIVSIRSTPFPSNPPTRKFPDYQNAPPMTREQKDTALGIARKSEKFQAYLNESHGPIMFVWAYPYSGVVHLSMTSGSAMSPGYGLVSVDVDLYRGEPGNVSFTDWKKNW